MELREYLFHERMTTVAFAEKIGWSVQAIRLIKRWDRRPSKSLALAIEKGTEGKVTVKELMALPSHSERKKKDDVKE